MAMSFDELKVSVGQIGLGTRISGEAPEADSHPEDIFQEAPQLNMGGYRDTPEWC